jgi:phosphate transport system substrate-binding protein|tara:strand:- start:785 stop:1765 length:981 start_codon:yes stop_codon:yes gene_type:complete
MFRKLIFGMTTVFTVTILSNSAQGRDRIQIVGSSTVYPFAIAVAEKIGKNGFKTPVIESTGTGGGIKLFCAGVGTKYPDMTNASRAMKKKEKAMCEKNGVTGIIEIIVGNDGIAFSNSLKGGKLNFTHKQLWMAMAEYGPKPKRWNEIDSSLPNIKIKIIAPPPTSGTRDAWNSLVMGKGCKSAGQMKSLGKKKCAAFREDGIVEEAGENDTLIVKRLAADKEVFGIFGFSFLDSNRDQIQGATIDGVEIGLDSIQSYKYPISRPLFFYVKKAHIGTVPGMKEYMEEFVSDSAVGEYGYLSDVGLVPLATEKLAKVRFGVSYLKTM